MKHIDDWASDLATDALELDSLLAEIEGADDHEFVYELGFVKDELRFRDYYEG